MTQAERLEAAAKLIAKAGKKALRDPDYAWNLMMRSGARWAEVERLVIEEKLKRGIITITDLTPEQRRARVDPNNLDLHAIAAGPIMLPGELYLPAGKISLAEAKARSAAQVLPSKPEAA